MRVFISWSGALSHKVASSLRDWLPSVLQAIEPWLSSQDIAPGARWISEISEQLAAVEVGIICLTAENLRSSWLNFEAGAISKQVQGARVCIYAIDLAPSDISGPLAQFQISRSTREDTLGLLRVLNAKLGPLALQEERLERSFDVWWPTLEAQLSGAVAEHRASVRQTKSLDEKVDEALSLLSQLVEANAMAEPPSVSPPTKSLDHKGPPRVFVGSSTEGLPVAEAIQLGLDNSAEVTVWNQDAFALSSTAIESIVDTAARYDFAVLVLTPDDLTIRQGASQSSPRDNLIFEVGLFTGILGRARTFVVFPRDVPMHQPSDMAGVTAATYSIRSDGNLVAALGPVCTRIKRAMGAM
ncbi:TIR domain-containing protein [Azotobacter chroococcum]|uniref:TIR domain-containing protein n=1 Tax=Azotobacter chroococcum TaxID=353 RepID=UPI00103EA5CF|nr:TIR domain-containing protein [Azotobacter chroococcum]TBW03655.1 TIR domain-containing protein [Azotobacter chroococcum]